jgi:glutathionyl-hydroquinone reductase
MQESHEILRFLQTGFDSLLPEPFKSITFYPPHLRDEIDQVTAWMQRDLNTGVYKAGFASSQEVYDKNIIPVFEALNKLEKLIYEKGGPYALGRDLTEVDLRLYPTLIRFDTVYVQHFKCNLGTIRHNYPVLNNWLKHLFWHVPGFKETTDFKHIKENVSYVNRLCLIAILMHGCLAEIVHKEPLRYQPEGYHTYGPDP